MEDSLLLSKLQGIRQAFRVARDVRAGTDGDPVAAAQLLAGVINGGAEAIIEAAKVGRLQDKILEAAPLLVTARLATPEAFEELRGLLSDIGAPPLLDDLPNAWAIPPVLDPMAVCYGIGYEIGSAAGGVDLTKEEIQEEIVRHGEPVNLGEVIRDSLAKHGILIEKDHAFEIVADVMEALGYEEVDPEDLPPAAEGEHRHAWSLRDPDVALELMVRAPVTPWMIDFQPVPAAQHRDTVPDDVRRRYGEGLKIMIKEMGLHPDAIVHAIFVSDETLAKMEDLVALEACDALRLRDAWEHHPDPAGWGPSSDRPFAVWYPVVRSAVTGPF